MCDYTDFNNEAAELLEEQSPYPRKIGGYRVPDPLSMAGTLSALHRAACLLGWHCAAGNRVRKFGGGFRPELCRHCRKTVGYWS